MEVVRGLLQGAYGILLRKEKRHQLVIEVRLIQEASVVEIDMNNVVSVYRAASMIQAHGCRSTPSVSPTVCLWASHTKQTGGVTCKTEGKPRSNDRSLLEARL